MRALSDATSIPQEPPDAVRPAAADASSAIVAGATRSAAAGSATPTLPGATDFAAEHAAGIAPLDGRRAVRWAVNVIAPGSGLILAGRSRLGVSVALVFTLAGVTACWGWWIVPLSIPPILRWLGLAAALIAGVGAQISLRRLHAARQQGQA